MYKGFPQGGVLSAPMRVLVRNWSNEVKYLGMILDSKLTLQAHLESKYNKAVWTFWDCQRIIGKTWGITSKIAHWIYVAMIRPMLTHAGVVWWPYVKLGVAKTMLGRLQRLAHLAITGAIRTTWTAAVELWLELPSLDVHIKNIAMNLCYRIGSTGSWQWQTSGTHTKHTHIEKMMGAEIPITKMRGD